MRVALVTNCTNRKALAPSVSARAIKARTLPTFVSAWQTKLRSASDSLPARELYLGRGFQEARRAWEETEAIGEADLFIASAGLGIVAANDKVPSYSITVAAQGEDSVVSKLGLVDASTWWDALTSRRHGLLARCAGADLVIVALSSPYLGMMRHELAAVAASTPKRLRIIARNDPGRQEAALTQFWIPYDVRLNGAKSPYAGAESDFAQRALRHFVEHVLTDAPRGSFQTHSDAVAHALSHMSRPRRTERTRLDDDQIVRLMRKIGPEAGAARMLRILRDENNVACEQSRCSALFKRAFPKTKAKSASEKDARKRRQAR